MNAPDKFLPLPREGGSANGGVGRVPFRGTIFCIVMTLLCVSFSEDLTVLIPRGAGGAGVAVALKKAHVIHSAWLFRLRLKFSNIHPRFYSGLIRLSLPANHTSLLQQLQDPTRLTYEKLTIPEGFNTIQIDNLLSEKGIITPDSFIEFCSDPTLFRPIIEKISSLSAFVEVSKLEGLLYPDTYHIEYYTSIPELVRLMLTNFANKALPLYQQYEKNLPTQKRWEKRAKKTRRGMRYQRILITEKTKGLSFYQVLKLASIVENEAKVATERPVIASVYLNRLNRKMALGSDPTVQYARELAGLPHKEIVYFKDLEIHSPYNTYKHSGLPPTPISNPGLDSIKAALYPATSHYLYFVATGDGSHHFSLTAKEHIAWSKKVQSK